MYAAGLLKLDILNIRFCDDADSDVNSHALDCLKSSFNFYAHDTPKLHLLLNFASFLTFRFYRVVQRRVSGVVGSHVINFIPVFLVQCANERILKVELSDVSICWSYDKLDYLLLAPDEADTNGQAKMSLIIFSSRVFLLPLTCN